MIKHSKVDSQPNNFRELKPGSFIYALDNALDPATCGEMIDRFEKNPDQHNCGRLGQDQNLDTDIKRSTDLRISGRENWADIDTRLHQSLSLGLSLISGIHPFFQSNPLTDIGYNLQRTDEGGFYHWHVDGGPGEFSRRQLVAIWYLNNVTDHNGGGTEFHFQNITVSPTTGMLILFPPFWTHIHRGQTLGKGQKYIATTWVCTQ